MGQNVYVNCCLVLKTLAFAKQHFIFIKLPLVSFTSYHFYKYADLEEIFLRFEIGCTILDYFC